MTVPVTGTPASPSRPVRRRLRRWQQEALAAYAAAGEPADFLITATPGAGKTAFALTLARDLLDRKVIRRVVVVCPTDHLRTQWAEAANAFGIGLDPSLSNQVGPIAADFDGCIVTYAQVAGRPALHDRRVTSVSTLVILDEIHHAGDGLRWGEGVLEAFGNARRRLAMTGTPFRTSTAERIPFVRYDTEADGAQRSVADYTYGYREALADRVVRPVIFAAYSGVARWRDSAGEVVAASLSERLTRDAEMTAWRTILDPGGQWIRHVVDAADHRLSELRRAVPDAGGMLLASDQDTARAYAAVLADVTGRPATVVLSDDSKATQRIEDFAGSDDRWLVAVRMVSEGVDIPRLAVGVWATSYRTPLFFAQAVGRFVRARRRGESATVFLPAVRPLLTMAAELESERDHVLAAPRQPDDAEPLLDVERTEPDAEGWSPLSAQAQFAHVLYGGRAVMGDETPGLSGEEADFVGIPGLLSPEQVAALLKRREAEIAKRAPAGSGGTPGEQPGDAVALHRRTSALRREINALVGRLARRTGAPHATVHARLRRRVPGPPSAQASLDTLTARRDQLLADLG